MLADLQGFVNRYFRLRRAKWYCPHFTATLEVVLRVP